MVGTTPIFGARSTCLAGVAGGFEEWRTTLEQSAKSTDRFAAPWHATSPCFSVSLVS